MREENLNVLFLAKFAPESGADYPMATEESDGIYAQYHYDIYQILKRVFPNTICANSVDILMDKSIKFDYVFSLLNRAPYRNSEIFVSALLEYLKVPYLGSTPNIRALAEDKHLAKIVAVYSGLNTPNWITIDSNAPISDKEPFPGPFFVKPRFGASSVFIDESSIAYSWEQAKTRIRELQNHNLEIIVEEFVKGTYYSLPIVINENIPTFLPSVKEESILKGNVVTYRQKRKLETGLKRSINTDPNLEFSFQKHAKNFLANVSPLDYTRIDFIVTKETIEFIEFNICCNLGKQSSFCLSANSVGLSQEQLVNNILNNSLTRQKVII